MYYSRYIKGGIMEITEKEAQLVVNLFAVAEMESQISFEDLALIKRIGEEFPNIDISFLDKIEKEFINHLSR